MAVDSFENLEVSQRASRLAVQIYEALADSRDYGLKDQMTRAAVSIASNIAEGSERNSPADFIRFLRIAKGSAAELRTQIYIACRIKTIPDQLQKDFSSELKAISSMIKGLINSPRSRQNAGTL